MEITLYSAQGQKTNKTLNIEDSLFGTEFNPNDHAIYLDVKQYLANQRQGTHKAKERGEVSGSTKKPWKQKGRGTARAGHKRSPLWRHGGRVFGPRPRSYDFKLNAKVKSLARRSAIAYKLREEKLLVTENFTYASFSKDTKPRTKNFISFLEGFKATSEKILLVLPALPALPLAPDTRKKRGLNPEQHKKRIQDLSASVKEYAAQKAIFDEVKQKNDLLYLSARNLEKVSVMSANDVNTYHIVNAGRVIMMEDAMKTISAHLKS